MSVDLTALPIAEAVPIPFRMSGVMRSPLGASQRILRLGSRWSLQVTTPPMVIEPTGRQWAARLAMALDDGALVRVRQPSRRSGMPAAGVTVGAAVAAGRAVRLVGLPANYSFGGGEWISFVVGGQRYLDQLRGSYQADGSGEALIGLVNLIREPIPAGAIAEVAEPKIEGTIEGDFGGAWGRNRLTSFSFMITEDN